MTKRFREYQMLEAVSNRAQGSLACAVQFDEFCTETLEHAFMQLPDTIPASREANQRFG